MKNDNQNALLEERQSKWLRLREAAAVVPDGVRRGTVETVNQWRVANAKAQGLLNRIGSLIDRGGRFHPSQTLKLDEAINSLARFQ